MTFGESLKRFREDFGLSQVQVANDIGVQPPQYRRYEWDKTSPSIELIYKLADKYHVTADYLLGLSDEPRTYDEQEVKEAFAIRDAWRQLQNILPAPLATAPKAVGA